MRYIEINHLENSDTLYFLRLVQGHEGHPWRQGWESLRFPTSRHLSLLYRYLPIRLDRQHGENHEGSGPPRQLFPWLHGCQEALGTQPWPQYHQGAQKQGWCQQERQVREGSGYVAFRNFSPRLWIQSRRSSNPLFQNSQVCSFVLILWYLVGKLTFSAECLFHKIQ